MVASGRGATRPNAMKKAANVAPNKSIDEMDDADLKADSEREAYTLKHDLRKDIEVSAGLVERLDEDNSNMFIDTYVKKVKA